MLFNKENETPEHGMVGHIIAVTARPGETMGQAVVRTLKALSHDEEIKETCGNTTEPEAQQSVAQRIKQDADARRLRNAYSASSAPHTFGFGTALNGIKNGGKVARLGWNGKDQWITLIKAGNAVFKGYDTQDCLGLKNAQGNMLPGWCPLQGDLFAEDWYVVD